MFQVLCRASISAVAFAHDAASQTSVAPDGMAIPACGAEADGRVYVALGAEVFAFRDSTPVPPVRAPKPMLFEVPSGRPVYLQVNQGALPLEAPERAASEGCRGNPAQRQTITIDPEQTFDLAPLGSATIRQTGPVTLTVRRWGDMDGMVGTRLPTTISSEQQQRVEQEARYARRQVSFCGSAEGQALMHNATFGCFYRPQNHPDYGWIGSYAPPRTDLGASSQKLSFACNVSHADARFTECTALYTLRPELDLEYTWIEAAQTPVLPALFAALLPATASVLAHRGLGTRQSVVHVGRAAGFARRGGRRSSRKRFSLLKTAAKASFKGAAG